MKPKNEVTEDARTKLLNTATALFAERGFAAVSIREVAEAAGVNSSMISYYFGGKENLYYDVLKNQLEKVQQQLATFLDSQLPPRERLRQYAQGIYQMHHTSPYLVRFMYSEMTNPTKAFEMIIKPAIAMLFNVLYQTIEEGKKDAQIKPEIDAANAAVSLAAIMNFYFIAQPLIKKILPPNSHDDNSYHYILQAIEIYLNGVQQSDE